MSGFLHEFMKVTVEPPAAGGTTAVDSTALDMAGFDGVIWIARLGTPAADNDIRAQQDTAANMAAAADLAGTLVSSVSDNVLVLDLQHPRERYVRCRVTRGTLTTVDTLVALQYRASKLPVQQEVSVTLEAHNAPAEGTA